MGACYKLSKAWEKAQQEEKKVNEDIIYHSAKIDELVEKTAEACKQVNDFENYKAAAKLQTMAGFAVVGDP